MGVWTLASVRPDACGSSGLATRTGGAWPLETRTPERRNWSASSRPRNSGGLWIVIMAIATDARARDTGMPAHYLLLTSLSIPLLMLGLVIESAVAFGIARFLERVRPDLVTRGAISLESLPEAEAR